MKNRKKKNAITLIALVITIVIMLLLAGVAIQMTMGENGLIAKSKEAQKAQVKAELYDTAKLSYANLKAKALENGEASPQAELALSTTEFTNKYNIVGDDVTDKKGNVIDTKANVLNVIQGTVVGGFSPGGTSSTESWPKTVGGVTIPEEDKDKLILKLIVKNNTDIPFGNYQDSLREIDPIEVDYGDGEKGEITDLYDIYYKHYDRGEYVLKFKNVKDFGLREFGDFEIEVLQWGKILEKNEENIIQISNVSKIYEPEPDRIPIEYINIKLTEIPEWLFSKKVTSKVMSKFEPNNSIVSIPEGLFKNNVNVTTFDSVFSVCSGLTSIPEGLFKNNVNVTSFRRVFSECSGLTSIPERLFENNVNVTSFDSVFLGCTGLTSIPEGLFKNNVNVTSFETVFLGCTGITSIPEGLFKNNVNVTTFSGVFSGCSGITSIPEGLFKNNVNVPSFDTVFAGCTGITSIPEGLLKNNVNIVRFDSVFSGCSGITSIPEGLFKNNVNVTRFDSVFSGCTGLTSIPEGLFKNNVNVTSFSLTFYGCTGLTSISDSIVEFAKKVKEKGGNTYGMFRHCTSASNYASIPDYMK